MVVTLFSLIFLSDLLQIVCNSLGVLLYFTLVPPIYLWIQCLLTRRIYEQLLASTFSSVVFIVKTTSRTYNLSGKLKFLLQFLGAGNRKYLWNDYCSLVCNNSELLSLTRAVLNKHETSLW